jgi:hypothetical protein
MPKPILQVIMVGTKQQMAFVKNFTAGMPELADLTGVEQAKEVITRAIDRAPIATGDMINSLKYRQTASGIFQIYFGDPVTSKKNVLGYPVGMVYPLAQDRGYARHRIHTSWIDERVRSNYQENGTDRWITVSEWHPFLSPAIREVEGLTKKTATTEINKLFKRSVEKSGALTK